MVSQLANSVGDNLSSRLEKEKEKETEFKGKREREEMNGKCGVMVVEVCTWATCANLGHQ